MINFENVYATVFNPSKNERGIALAGLGTGRKVVNKSTNETTYVNSSWGNASFLGEEVVKKFDTLQNLDRILIKKGRIERVKGLNSQGEEIKDANGRAVYYLNIAIFDFVKASEVNSNNPSNTADNTDSEQNLPF